MPRQHIHHSRITYQFPGDFGDRLKRFQRETRMPWAELQRRLGAGRETVRRWREKGVLPCTQYYAVILAWADSFGLGRLYRD